MSAIGFASPFLNHYCLTSYPPPRNKSTKSTPGSSCGGWYNPRLQVVAVGAKKKDRPGGRPWIVGLTGLEANDVRGLQALGAISNLELDGYAVFQ